MLGRLFKKDLIPIKISTSSPMASVEEYWSERVVEETVFKNAKQSIKKLEERFKLYPFSKELLDLYQPHEGETILDYGCGPGNDLVGYFLYSRARHIIGVDVSFKALLLAQHRLSVHKASPSRVCLRLVRDSSIDTGTPTQTVDHINCLGVLHHVSNPLEVLSEFYVILKDSGTVDVTVHNYNSIWLHLIVAYEMMMIKGEFNGFTVREAFSHTTDGINCPISNCWTQEEFTEMAEASGFEVEYKGGHFVPHELDAYHTIRRVAIASDRLPEEHKDYLLSLTEEKFPRYRGKYAGAGGVYRLTRR